MILSDFLVETSIGLYCSYGNFYLDPKIGVKDAVVSHAHGDHACSGNVNVYCTEVTSQFMRHRYKLLAAVRFSNKAYHEQFFINDVKITLYPAGHILGSAQVLMEYQEVRYLYTGDYKLQYDETCERIEFVEADVLITESTFADPDLKHPAAETEILKLKSTASTIMLGAYALGKSQRLIRLINEYCTEKRILIHHSIMPFVKIYEQNGIDLGRYEFYDRKLMKASVPHLIYLVPPLVFASNIKAISAVKVFATGWKNLQQPNDLKLFISDHVDWVDIIQTIDKVNPQQLWTTHGNGLQLQTYFERTLVVKLLN